MELAKHGADAILHGRIVSTVRVQRTFEAQNGIQGGHNARMQLQKAFGHRVTFSEHELYCMKDIAL